jgi:hypothetical protein
VAQGGDPEFKPSVLGKKNVSVSLDYDGHRSEHVVYDP